MYKCISFIDWGNIIAATVSVISDWQHEVTLDDMGERVYELDHWNYGLPVMGHNDYFGSSTSNEHGDNKCDKKWGSEGQNLGCRVEMTHRIHHL